MGVSMEEEMFAFFPNGIRALLIDNDPNFVRSAAVMLSLLNFKVATCGSPSSALRLLTGDTQRDVDVVLSDAHKVATCGFDFRDIIEPDLRIPVIYIFSPETPIDADDMYALLHTIHTATYVIKKPLDPCEVVTLWRVVAWRKCFLDARMANGGDGTAPAVAGGHGGSMLPLSGRAAGDDDDREEGRVHFKVVRSGRRKKQKNGSGTGGAGSSETQLKHRVMWTPCLKQKFERAVEDIGIDGHPSKILERMNVGGLQRNHVASYLQKYRKKLMNKNNKFSTFHRSPGPDCHPPQESLFVQAVLPMLNIPPYNPQIFADGAGPSNVSPAAAFAGNDAHALAPLPPVLQQPAGNVSNNIALAAMPADGQQSSGGQVAFPQLFNFFGPFTYQGQPPPAAQNMLLEQQRETEIQPPFEQPVGDPVAGATAAAAHAGALDNCAGLLVAPLSLGAAPSEAAMQALFNMAAESLVEPHGVVAVASEVDEALIEAFGNSAGPFVASQVHDLAVPAAEENAPAMGASANSNGALLVASGQGPAVASGEGELAPMGAADEDYMFPLGAFLGLDMPMDIDGVLAQQGAIDGHAAAAGVGGLLNGYGGGMGNWYLGTEGCTLQDEIFKDNTEDFMMPNDMTERE